MSLHNYGIVSPSSFKLCFATMLGTQWRSCYSSGGLSPISHRSQVRLCGVCGGIIDAKAGFLRVLPFPLPILILPNVPYSSVIRPWYSGFASGRRTKCIWSLPTAPKEIEKLGSHRSFLCLIFNPVINECEDCDISTTEACVLVYAWFSYLSKSIRTGLFLLLLWQCNEILRPLEKYFTLHPPSGKILCCALSNSFLFSLVRGNNKHSFQ